MGGKVTSYIHCDMVCRSPKVLVDGKTIIDNGQIVLETTDWRETSTPLCLQTDGIATSWLGQQQRKLLLTNRDDYGVFGIRMPVVSAQCRLETTKQR